MFKTAIIEIRKAADIRKLSMNIYDPSILQNKLIKISPRLTIKLIYINSRYF